MPAGYSAYSVSVTGGLGGKLEDDPDNNHANAVKVLANLLLVAIRQCDIKLYIISFEGGDSSDNIPSEAKAKIALPSDAVLAFEELITQCDEALEAEYAFTDADIQVDGEASIWRSTIISEEGTHLLLATINGIPVGTTEYTTDGSTPVVANNIGVVSQQAASDKSLALNAFRIVLRTTGSDEEKTQNLATQIRRIFEVSGATVE